MAGLFAIVYGFAHAETDGWTDSVTLGALAAGVLLLGTFVAFQRRSSHPLLPLRVVLDRDRAGSLIALALAAAGVFGVFLFLTYYLQGTLGYSPITTGVAFLPMIGGLVLSATLAPSLLAPRVAGRYLVGGGMLIAAGGMLLLTQVGVDSAYTTGVLPGLVVMGLGVGLVFGIGLNSAVAGVGNDDASVASALANTAQQIGGSIGTALLSTVSATAVATYLADRTPTDGALAQANVEGYATAFWWAAAIFAVGALITGLLMRGGVAVADPEAEPVFAH